MPRVPAQALRAISIVVALPEMSRLLHGPLGKGLLVRLFSRYEDTRFAKRSGSLIMSGLNGADAIRAAILTGDLH